MKSISQSKKKEINEKHQSVPDLPVFGFLFYNPNVYAAGTMHVG